VVEERPFMAATGSAKHQLHAARSRVAERAKESRIKASFLSGLQSSQQQDIVNFVRSL
jgi:hypothetical protein